MDVFLFYMTSPDDGFCLKHFMRVWEQIGLILLAVPPVESANNWSNNKDLDQYPRMLL